MEADSGNRIQLQQMNAHNSTEPEHLPCPRCDSTNTKFCYYNNYNLSQPRHFCKSCRRYWTQGGTLRNVPVGGGTRKGAKRSRTSSAADPIPATPLSAESPAVKTEMPNVNLNESVSGGFSSLLMNQQCGVGGSGFLALGGFGLGLGSGFDEVGFNMGRVWSIPDVGEGGGAVAAPAFNTWQMGSMEGVFADGGDCFGWPDLAISTPGNGLIK